MLRTSITRSTALYKLTPIMSVRYTSSEGAAGSGFSRPGGQHSGDSFTKREKAAEDLYVRQMEKQKLKELKIKLQQQRKHLDDLDKHISLMLIVMTSPKNRAERKTKEHSCSNYLRKVLH
ncbi:mitochondrial ATPase inhibitor, IATP-domain-containing protein [Geopyxis carbonaria]|nr:mitochondrial ATPase inhibitor, IATP-domain-containing protein [Geopyxis carbonaria]